MTTGRSKWQAFSRATIFFMFSLLSIFVVRSLINPPLLADEFDVTTPEKRPDFERMKLKARAELNQELEKCHKLKPEECQKCKEEAGKRFALEIERINQMWRNWHPRRNAKTNPTGGKQPTPPPQAKQPTQPTPSTKEPTKPTTLAKKTTPPTPQAEQPKEPPIFQELRKNALAEWTQRIEDCTKDKSPWDCQSVANKRFNLDIEWIDEMSRSSHPRRNGKADSPSGHKPSPPSTPSAKPSAPTTPSHTEDIPNLGPAPCVDLAESPYLVDRVLATREEQSFNCHFYTKTYLRTINIINNRILFPDGNPHGNRRDECLTKEDLKKVRFQPVNINRARVGDILVVEGPHAWPSPHQHSAVVIEVDKSGRILKLRQKDDPDHCVYDTTLDQFIKV